MALQNKLCASTSRIQKQCYPFTEYTHSMHNMFRLKNKEP